MPKAVANTEATFKYELASLPGGFVVLRKMNYGEILKRRDMSMKMRAGEGREGPEVELTNLKVMVFEFSKSIVDHNLEDEEERKLDLTNRDAVMRLDSRIAQEIETKIMELNEPPGEEESKS